MNETPLIQLYPNPNSGDFTLAVEGNTEKNLSLAVMNIQGKMIREMNIETGLAEKLMIPVTISDYPDGIYVVKVIGKKLMFVEKIIKQ